MLASTGAFLTALDIVVVAMALPSLQSRLGASLAELDWTINAYTLAVACLMLTGAALGDRFGRRRMYVLGVLVFTGGSALCALSTSTDQLIGARLLQGVGAALLGPLTLTLIIDVFPPKSRGAAIGIWSGISGLGVAAGPLVGGAIVDTLAWQAIFWLNVPIGVVLAILSARLLRESRGPRRGLDFPGLALAGVGLFGLTWALIRAPVAGWGGPEVLGALAGGVVTMVAFVFWERHTIEPLLPLGFFRLRGFTVGNLMSLFQFMSLIGALFMITQLLQVGLGNDPLVAGMRILPWNLAPMFTAPIAGALAGRYGNRPFMIGGMALHIVGLGWLTLVAQPGVGYATLVFPLIVSGVGLSMCFPTIASTVTGAVPVESVGAASGINQTFTQVGGVFGVALVSVVFAAHGSYASPTSFLDGFTPAMWVATAIPLAALAAALFAPRRSPDSHRVAAHYRPTELSEPSALTDNSSEPLARDPRAR